MICITLQNRTKDEIFEILDRADVEMAEIRLDRCHLSMDDIEEIFSCCDKPLVATCRAAEMTGDDAAARAESMLLAAIDAGAAYADLEIEAPAMMSKRIRRKAEDCGTVLVRSYHDFNGTDSLESLKALVEKCHRLGAEIVKIVTTAKSQEDAERVAALYNTFAPESLIAFCMGAEGRQSRLDCLAKGAPYTYAALDSSEAAAPGQWPYKEMREAIYNGWNQVVADEALTMPASKSFAQRAIIAAALADGTSHLYGYSTCGDNASAIAVARELGAEVFEDGSTLIINGINASEGSFAKSSLHTGESGLLTRMMIPVLSGIAAGDVLVTGEKTLVTRPLAGAREIMSSFGVSLVNDDPDVARVPLTVKGHLTSGDVEVSGKGGSQIISGLLMSLPLLKGNSELYLTEPKSIPYIYITVDVLKRFGIRIGNEMEGGEDFLETQDWQYCTGIAFHIRGGHKYKAADIDIEGDWSAAANFMVAGALGGQTRLSGLDTSSLQADLSIMDILVQAGASVSQDENGEIVVTRAPLRAFETDASNCPDLFPILAVLAALCQGTSRIAGVGRLKGKESDRASAICEMLTAMGVKNSIKGDVLVIQGHSLVQRLLKGWMLKGGSFTSRHDHRMVMALKVASLFADSPIEIDDAACVEKSFPSFHEVFEKII